MSLKLGLMPKCKFNFIIIRLKTKEKKLNEGMDAIIQIAPTDAEKKMHAIFKEFLEKDVALSKKDATREKAKVLKLEDKEGIGVIKSYKQMLMVYCEEELEYQINAMQDSYQAFQDIFNLSDELLFKEVLKKGKLVTDNKEIEDFIRLKKEAGSTKFDRKGSKKPRENP